MQFLLSSGGTLPYIQDKKGEGEAFLPATPMLNNSFCDVLLPNTPCVSTAR